MNCKIQLIPRNQNRSICSSSAAKRYSVAGLRELFVLATWMMMYFLCSIEVFVSCTIIRRGPLTQRVRSIVCSDGGYKHFRFHKKVCFIPCVFKTYRRLGSCLLWLQRRFYAGAHVELASSNPTPLLRPSLVDTIACPLMNVQKTLRIQNVQVDFRVIIHFNWLAIGHSCWSAYREWLAGHQRN